MANRGTDPERIEQALTRLENMLVDQLTATRGSGQKAAIGPRSGPARAGQSTYQLNCLPGPLPSTETRQRIRDRIAGVDPSSGDEG